MVLSSEDERNQRKMTYKVIRTKLLTGTEEILCETTDLKKAKRCLKKHIFEDDFVSYFTQMVTVA